MPSHFGFQALEPVISGQIMNLHYNKHHQTYINNLNNALKSLHEAISSNNLVQQLELQQAIKFNAGGHINHTLFWENLAPQSKAGTAKDHAFSLHKTITARWGTLEQFKAAFQAVALALQGSGWTWLTHDVESGALEILTSKDQDLPPARKVPILGVDMWEHAYYLQYMNNKKDYVENIWSVVNWATLEKRYKASGAKGVFGELAGLVTKI